MPTPYEEVYFIFLSKVEDYDLLEHTDGSGTMTDDMKSVLYPFLRSSIVRNSNVLSVTRDDSNSSFVETLNDTEIEILASQMIVEYLTPKINSTEHMAQALPDREYKIYSQSKHLEEMINLKKESQKEVSHLKSMYSYQSGLGDWQ